VVKFLKKKLKALMNQELLNSNDPKNRTIVAIIIGKRKCIDLVLPLCLELKKEMQVNKPAFLYLFDLIHLDSRFLFESNTPTLD
jgi:hypothetical protein